MKKQVMTLYFIKSLVKRGHPFSEKGPSDAELLLEAVKLQGWYDLKIRSGEDAVSEGNDLTKKFDYSSLKSRYL